MKRYDRQLSFEMIFNGRLDYDFTASFTCDTTGRV